MLQQVQHPNIIKYIDHKVIKSESESQCIIHTSQYYIIQEYDQNSGLYKLIEMSKKKDLEKKSEEQYSNRY